MNDFLQRLKQLKNRSGLNNKQIGNLIGKNPQSVSNWLNEKSLPSKFMRDDIITSLESFCDKKDHGVKIESRKQIHKAICLVEMAKEMLDKVSVQF